MKVARHPVMEAVVLADPAAAYLRRINTLTIRRVLCRPANHCTWCSSACIPPRSSWCSKSCIDEALLYTSDSAMSRFVWKRDSGLCVLCGSPGSEVDHIVPVIRGGGLCDDSNLRVLCFACHLKFTVALNKELAKERGGSDG